MRIRIVDPLWIVAVALPLAGGVACKRSSDSDAPQRGAATLTSAVGDEQKRDSHVEDVDVTAAVLRELHRDPTIDSNVVEVVTRNGVVEISGTVDNLLAKERATRHAEAVRGVRAVSNRISVEPPHVDDAVLARSVKDALHSNAATEPFDTTVAARNGVITLKGNVHSYQEWAAAQRIATRTRGVSGVDNQIEIAPPVQRADDEILHDVQERLRWDVLVDARLVLTQVKAGKVFLGGVVGSAAEKRRTALDAWVGGVRDVDASAMKVESWARRDDLRKEPVARADADVERAIRDAVSYDPRLRAAVIQPTVRSGLALLHGTVASLEAKRAAGQLARNTVGVVDVDNQIDVARAESLSDLETAKRVTAALAANPYTGHDHVIAKAARGRVTLTGAVDSTFEKTEAEHVASGVRGVSDIDDKLVVAKPTVGFVYDPEL